MLNLVESLKYVRQGIGKIAYPDRGLNKIYSL